MFQTSFDPTLPSPKEGDTLFIKSMNDYGQSTMVITYVFDGGYGGTVRFPKLGEVVEDGEYGELYETDFQLIYAVETA
jgi:hypothetical protein